MRTPQIPAEEVLRILTLNRCNLGEACALAIRGYYLDTMGKPGVNDRRIYDDAVAIYHPDRGVLTYQGNTDPNGYRKGHGTAESTKGMGMLKKGVWRYGKGLHRGRRGFRQCQQVTVIRDGNPPYEDTGWHAINIHSGAAESTSSLGCQTLPPSTFSQFQPLFYQWLDECKNAKMKNDNGELVRSFDYVLIEEPDRRQGNLTVPRVAV
jgi:lysozyme